MATCLNLGISSTLQRRILLNKGFLLIYDLPTFYSVALKERELKTTSIVLTEKLGEEPYSAVLCYPKVDVAELQNRVNELQNLGVKAVEFSGEASAFNVPVLGKGYVGVVVVAHLGEQRVALKMRRLDAGRADLNCEAEMLAKANSVNVGPKLLGGSKDFLLMQLIEGDLLPRWLEANKERETVRSVLSEILEQCYRLDSIGLDHGEVSNAPKHVIVDRLQKPWIVDFETASTRRKASNVTAICQFLFSSRGRVAQTAAMALGARYIDNIIDVLRIYKKSKTRQDFERVLQTCLF